MQTYSIHSNQFDAAEAFSLQAPLFDKLYENNATIQYQRKRVRTELLSLLKPGSHILELNSGTGDDAIYFAQLGHYIHATDISEGMQKVLQEKVQQLDIQDLVTSELCSFTALKSLENRGPYDAVFSNFGGLNCTDKLDSVLQELGRLLKPGGTVTLVMMPRFCLWEFLMVFKGKFTTAFRRFFSRSGRKAHIEGKFFKCWYHHPKNVVKKLKEDFELVTLEGLCTIMPPSYIEGFANKYPTLFTFLEKAENKFAGSFPWKYIGDYYIISFRKKVANGQHSC